MPTVAKQLGQAPHLSPLLRRLRKMGLAEPEDLRRLAVARGCTHYRRPDDINPLVDPGSAQVSNLELAIAMVTAAQSFDPVLVRCAAQLLSGEDRGGSDCQLSSARAGGAGIASYRQSGSRVGLGRHREMASSSFASSRYGGNS